MNDMLKAKYTKFKFLVLDMHNDPAKKSALNAVYWGALADGFSLFADAARKDPKMLKEIHQEISNEMAEVIRGEFT